MTRQHPLGGLDGDGENTVAQLTLGQRTVDGRYCALRV
jgi:hypothetical protein